MPPVFIFNRGATAGTGSVATGSFVPNNTVSQVIATGLTSPIKHLRIYFFDATFNGNFTIERFAAGPGTRGCLGWAPAGSSVAFATGFGTGVGFVNGGVDFELRNDDDFSLSTWVDQTCYWTAWS